MADPDPQPGWVDAVVACLGRVRPPDRDRAGRDAQRPAAALVLLVDGPTGPELLLTERASTLRDAPGALVFPGGAVEPGDAGPVETALREAAEETGIDPERVHVVGVLPPLPVVGGNFVLTAVVGWCVGPELIGVRNASEVGAIVQVPLHELAATSGRVQCVERDRGPGSVLRVDGADVGPTTATVIGMLLDCL